MLDYEVIGFIRVDTVKIWDQVTTPAYNKAIHSLHRVYTAAGHPRWVFFSSDPSYTARYRALATRR